MDEYDTSNPSYDLASFIRPVLLPTLCAVIIALVAGIGYADRAWAAAIWTLAICIPLLLLVRFLRVIQN